MAMEKKGLGDLLAKNIIFRSLNITCSVLITVLLTRLMGTGGYGLLSLLVANASVFNLLTCLGAESGITYHYSAGNLRRSSILSIGYLVITFQVLLLAVAEGIYRHYAGTYWLLETETMPALTWGILYLFSIAMIDKYLALLNAAHLYTLANKIILAINIISLLAFAYFAFAQPANINVYLKIFILSSVTQAVSMIFFFHYYAKQPLRFGRVTKIDWKTFFSYSSIVLITNVIQFLAYRIDYWFIDFYHGKDQLGLYSFAVKLGQLLWILPLLMAGILFPRIAGKATKPEEDKWVVLIRIATACFLLASIIAALTAVWIIPFVAGNSFRESVTPFIYLLPGLFFFCFNIIFAAYFAGVGKLFINLRGSAICFLIVLVADLLLIPRFGINGAAIASSLAYLAAGLHHLWIFAQHKKIAVSAVVVAKKSDWNTAMAYLKKYIPRL